jgi:hypothetical protein
MIPSEIPFTDMQWHPHYAHISNFKNIKTINLEFQVPWTYISLYSIHILISPVKTSIRIMSNFPGIHVRATYFFDCSFKLNIIWSFPVILKYFERGRKRKERKKGGGGGEDFQLQFPATSTGQFLQVGGEIRPSASSSAMYCIVYNAGCKKMCITRTEWIHDGCSRF